MIAAALLTGWLAHQFEGFQPLAPAKRDEEPDYFLENFTTTTTDESGTLTRALSAKRLLHFPDTDTNELTEPHLVLFRTTGTPWHVESERGWISGSGDVVLLLGRVHAWRDDARGERLVDIHTRDMRILPNDDYGETDSAAIIRSRGSEARGVGLRVDADQDRVELLADVSTVYEPRRPATTAGPEASSGDGRDPEKR